MDTKIRLKRYGLVAMASLMALTIALTPAQSYAQADAGKPELTGTRKQVATIVFAGLAGAILGLSTLSFYGRPQDHLSNIAVGFAVGVIGGAIFTTYKAATRPYEAYDLGQNKIEFHNEEYKRYLEMNQQAPRHVVGYAWTFN
jgi:hypothetical protein